MAIFQVAEDKDTHMNSQMKQISKFRLDQTEVFIFLLARLPLVLFSLSEPSESSWYLPPSA